MYTVILNKIANNRVRTSLSHKLRKERFSKFIEKSEVTFEDKILYVGGHSDTWINTGFEENVTLLNIKKPNGFRSKKGIYVYTGQCVRHAYV